MKRVTTKVGDTDLVSIMRKRRGQMSVKSTAREPETKKKKTNKKSASKELIGELKDFNENNIDLTKATIINPKTSEKYEEYVNQFYELRKAKGMTVDKAREMLKDNMYFGTMMVKQGDADGLVSGACHSTANTLRPALQILKTAPGTKLVSAFFVMVVPDCEYGENGTFVFGDCGLNENPDEEALSEIAISSSKSFRQLKR